jgi:hypothetical protein
LIAKSAHTRAVIESLEPRTFFAATILPNTPVVNDPAVQHQPSITVDPIDRNHLVTAYLDYSLVNTGYGGVGVSVSQDGGKTWTRSSIPLPAGFDEGAANPIAKFDDAGNVYVSFQAIKFLGPRPPITNAAGADPDGVRYRTYSLQSNNGIFVVKSADGGATWSSPVTVTSHTYDGSTKVLSDITPDLAIDTLSNSPNHGNIYVTWTRVYPKGQFPGNPDSDGGTTIHIAVSSDGGASFQPQVPPKTKKNKFPISVLRDTFFRGDGPPEGVGNATSPRLAIGAGGSVYVAFYDFGNFIVLHSEDGGHNFNAADKSLISQNLQAVFDNSGNANADLAAGPDNHFRVQVMRNIVADPVHEGVIYVAEPVGVLNVAGNLLDTADIYYAKSTDGGLHWQTLQVKGKDGSLNDDNGGVRATDSDPGVNARQFFSRLSIDAAGNIAAVWYDTRHDPANRKFDLFGTVSTDGGETFSPNFRITNQSIDADLGAYTDARGETDFYFGDFLGLTVSNGVAYTAWTDTRQGNQDVYFATFDVSAPPAPTNDRFEPNDLDGNPTDLGLVVRRAVPRLALASGDVDTFKFQSRSTGPLTITAMQRQRAHRLRLELFDADGVTLLATGTSILDARGSVIGQRISLPTKTGNAFVLRVSSVDGKTADYSLDVDAFTADLGPVAHHATSGVIAPDDVNYFLFSAAASGTFKARLAQRDVTGGGKLSLTMLDPETLEPVSLETVNQGDSFIAQIGGTKSTTAGAFTLRFDNLDVFSTTGRSNLVFPAGDGPSQIEMGDVNKDGFDDALVTDAIDDTLSVLLANGDGTFQSPRQFPLGAFISGSADTLVPLNLFKRDLVLGDFDRDGNLDAAVNNNDSADISVLLGRGDGTFQPQRRFDATAKPFAIDAGDLNGDGVPDLAVMDTSHEALRVSVLLGLGDGSFAHQVFVEATLSGSGFNSPSDVKIADVNHDNKPDLLITGSKDQRTYVLLNSGDGVSFARPDPSLEPSNDANSFPGGGPELRVVDLNGDGNLDVVNAIYYNSAVSYAFGNGDGMFLTQNAFNEAGQAPVGVVVADIASVDADGAVVIGTTDGIPDFITAASGAALTSFHGPPEVTVTAGYLDDDGVLTYDKSVVAHLASATQPISVSLGDLNGDGKLEAVFIDVDGVHPIFNEDVSITPNATRDTARNLGTVVHTLETTKTIVPEVGERDAWYALTVPTEAADPKASEVIDIAAIVSSSRGAGIDMEVTDAAGDVLATGRNVRIAAQQGHKLFVHVFAKADATGALGSSAYTLDIDVLPQVVTVETQTLLPGTGNTTGGPTSSVVITFIGDRLDEQGAEDPGNYSLIWLGDDGVFGTDDDRVVPIDGADRPAVYNPSTNLDVSSGRNYPTAVKQTVTLLSSRDLPAGDYRVVLSSNVVANYFNGSERTLLRAATHPIVSLSAGQPRSGATLDVPHLVKRVGEVGDFAVFKSGTPFLSQLHGDLGAMLDQSLSSSNAGDVTGTLLEQIRARLALSRRNAKSMLAIFLDPVGIDLQDPSGQRVQYDLKGGTLNNSVQNAFVSVASNVELILIPLAEGQFTLNVDDVPATARGGAVIFGQDQAEVRPITDDLQAGERQFVFNVRGQAPESNRTGSLPEVVQSTIDVAPAAQPSGVAALAIAADDAAPRATPSQPLTKPSPSPAPQPAIPLRLASFKSQPPSPIAEMYQKLLQVDPNFLQYILQIFEQLRASAPPQDAPRETAEPAASMVRPPSGVKSAGAAIQRPRAAGNASSIAPITDPHHQAVSLILVPLTLAAEAPARRTQEKKR